LLVIENIKKEENKMGRMAEWAEENPLQELDDFEAELMEVRGWNQIRKLLQEASNAIQKSGTKTGEASARDFGAIGKRKNVGRSKNRKGTRRQDRVD
jgi:hypothetical protein